MTSRDRSNRRSAVPLALAGLALTLAACAEPAPPVWHTDVIADLGAKLGGCAVGDVDERYPGAEIVAVDVDGRVIVAHRDATGTWQHTLAVTLTGEAIQCAIGDLDPRHDGLEIITVGKLEGDEDSPGPGAVHIVRRSGAAWTSELIFEDDALVHAVDIERASHGTDVALVAGYTDIAYHLVYADGGWSAEQLAPVGGDAKSALVIRDDLYAIGCATGALVLLERDGETWTPRTIHRAPSSQARLAIGPDDTVLACRNDGGLTLVGLDGSVTDVYQESDRLRGSVAADLEPESLGLELATVGYSGKITVLRRSDKGWMSEVIGHDPDRLHHLAVGTLDDLGPILVACGYGGRLVLAHR